jgi:glutaminase
MYDFAGEWLVSVGLPAKSGVSGGIFAVLPGRLGIAVFSPRLDPQGNSVRGVAVCRDLSQDLALHLVRPGERPAPPVRHHYTLADRSSKRVRPESHRNALRAAASKTAVVELPGELGFSAIEAFARTVELVPEPPELVVLDLRRVVRADEGGLRFLVALAESVHARDGHLVLAPDSGANGYILEDLPESVAIFPNLDRALEWCEDDLLRRLGHEPSLGEVALADHELLAGLSPSELGELASLLGTVKARAGTLLVRQGDRAEELFLVTSGTLSVVRDGSDGRSHRLTTLSAGMTFGELAFVARGVRAAYVQADSDVECRTLPYVSIDGLAETNPVLHGKLIRNMLRVVVGTLHVMNAEVDLTR